MSSDILQRFMKDLIKSAKATEGFIKGSRMTVEIGTMNKTANHAGLGAAFLGPVGAAMGADDGQRMRAVGGNILGGAGGSLAGGGIGALLGLLAGNPAAGASIGSGLGGYAGSIYGASRGGEDDRNMLQRGADKLSSAAEKGIKAAAARFGIKEAFLPLLGAIAGPMLGRAAVGGLAKGVGGKMLGGMAGKIAPHIGGGMGGAAFDMAASAGGGMLGQKMQGQPG